jgi:hypothetical protein
MEAESFVKEIRPELPLELLQGLLAKDLVRVGGLVLEATPAVAPRVVALIRSAGLPDGMDWSEILDSDVVDAATSASLAGLSLASPLGLGIVVMGFRLVRERLGTIEARLSELEEKLEQIRGKVEDIDYKVDLQSYAKLRGALDLAHDAFTVTDVQNRQNCALQAIGQLKESEHYYSKLYDHDLEAGGHAAADYLSTLFLAYVGEVRCWLELDEIQKARARLQEAHSQVTTYAQHLVKIMLTDRPAIYLCPELSDQVDLDRLTRCFQWLDPAATPSSVFQTLRADLWELARGKSRPPIEMIRSPIEMAKLGFGGPWKEVVDSLPAVLWDPKLDVEVGRKGKTKEVDMSQKRETVLKRLPGTLSTAEVVIETHKRFDGFRMEVELINQEGIKFQDWRKLTPEKAVGGGFACILLSKPVQLSA